MKIDLRLLDEEERTGHYAEDLYRSGFSNTVEEISEMIHEEEKELILLHQQNGNYQSLLVTFSPKAHKKILQITANEKLFDQRMVVKEAIRMASDSRSPGYEDTICYRVTSEDIDRIDRALITKH